MSEPSWPVEGARAEAAEAEGEQGPVEGAALLVPQGSAGGRGRRGGQGPVVQGLRGTEAYVTSEDRGSHQGLIQLMF